MTSTLRNITLKTMLAISTWPQFSDDQWVLMCIISCKRKFAMKFFTFSISASPSERRFTDNTCTEFFFSFISTAHTKERTGDWKIFLIIVGYLSEMVLCIRIRHTCLQLHASDLMCPYIPHLYVPDPMLYLSLYKFDSLRRHIVE